LTGNVKVVKIGNKVIVGVSVRVEVNIDESRLYRTGEVGELVGVTRQTVLSWVKRGWVKAIRVGKHYRIAGSELKRFLNEGTEKE